MQKTSFSLRSNEHVETEALALKIRRHALMMTSSGGSSHVGSVLSIADILAVLYGKCLRFDPNEPKAPSRDRFILSKGHAGAGVYAALAEVGFFDIERLRDHYQNGSVFSGHVSHKNIPGVELSTGSLGHGFSVGVGMAWALCQKGGSQETHVVLSDGECDEGSNWEAALFASHHRLSNLILTVDYNKLQSLESTEKTLDLEPFEDKWRAFGWRVLRVNGHDHLDLSSSYQLAREERTKPCVLIADTTKGKGVSFMEDQVLWHYRSPQGAELARALQELGELNHA